MNEMKSITFEILGDPMGKQRPKITVLGSSRYAHAYTPKETVNYESKVVYAYKQANGIYLGNQEITAIITAYFKLQSKHYGKKGINAEGVKKLEGKINPTKAPDCDNIAKIILDALNGIAFADDGQVTNLIVRKRYAEQPKVSVLLGWDEEIPDDPNK